MAATAGRKFKIKDAGVPIAGIRTKSMTIGNTEIDVTTDDEDGIRTLLLNAAETTLEAAEKFIDVTFDGLTTDDALAKAAAEGTALVKEYDLELASGAKITADFALTNLELTGEYQGATAFSGELKSTGAWTWTDAP